jgi:glutamine amidotransferase
MCRWLAYCGDPVFLDQLIFQPENSLISQSRRALQSISPTNGDGFGIGWYDLKPEPGLYRDILPAWADPNLRSLCGQIRSRLFFGHVRASTGTATARANCHPFQQSNWLFMHNGAIGGFETLRRDLMLALTPQHFRQVQGSTDSEIFFHLMAGNGLDDDPQGAFARSVGQVLAMMRAAGIDEPLRMTAALSDGQSIYALRYASDDAAPSLFYGCGVQPHGSDGKPVGGCESAVLILSEPLDSTQNGWISIPQSHLLIATAGAVTVEHFTPLM